MKITYRLEKGTPLTCQEADDNIRQLSAWVEECRLSLERVSRATVAEVILHEEKLLFKTASGETHAPVPLPDFSWKPRGAWSADNAYQERDIVSHNNALYVCISAHEKSDYFVANSWREILKISSPCLPVHEKSDLPDDTELGSIVIVCGKTPRVAYYDGENWRWINDDTMVEVNRD